MSTGNINPLLPAGLPSSDSIPGDPSPLVSSAFAGDFLGLSMPDDEQLWGLGSMSPMGTGSWDTKTDAASFANSALERDLKNTQVRNGQPTPPPYDDQNARDLSGMELESAGKRRRAREYKTAAASLSPGLDDDNEPQQERAKRAKFLERNRLAASKCRQKKKEHTQQLEYRYKEQSEKKERLVAEITRLRSEILGLKNEVLKHAQCGDEPIKLHLAQMVKKITDTDGPLPPGPVDPPPPVEMPVDVVPASPSDLEPAAAAAAEAFEQQLRRDSEASLVSESSYAFSADDTFEDLINV
ncbi:Rho GTPase activation protein [Penicillium alfredii]|uniref:Rho GTPase activation protein n=1 Tax=Penicillium alfredii TaxID=1506179 RepID=A0A9W9FKK2_9EURO|nr:Rho GTPase activation protein [Penicillium alfredii]KAJ5101877.1 Rho GTPase activation protein [Penicillium alfredii]